MSEIRAAWRRLKRALRMTLTEWMISKIMDLEMHEWSLGCASAFQLWQRLRPPIEEGQKR